jgi:hypothetical protein
MLKDKQMQLTTKQAQFFKATFGDYLAMLEDKIKDTSRVCTYYYERADKAKVGDALADVSFIHLNVARTELRALKQERKRFAALQREIKRIASKN